MRLSKFEKPSRYINREVNAIYREARVRVALAFPDVYDVGMSHLGLKILYAIINSLPYAAAERVFSPWTDLESEMKANGTLLSSLETKRPLRDFDIIGFSLQYELSYPTVLNMLSLGGVPVRAADRGVRHPLVIAGGPCTVNPAPVSAFIDVFLVGDGEEATAEIIKTFHDWKEGGEGKKDSLLQALAGIDGVYVPAIHGPNTARARIKRRFLPSLDDSPYPVAPVVPYTQIIHDRITVELSRGCSQGCRFCQAGMIYRPQRERSPEQVIRIIEESLRNTGYEEVSLSSLSAGDYPELLPLVRELNRRFSRKMVSISLPSLRVGAVNQDVLREIKSVRKTGFTIAPEAATERLRMAINKDFSDEDYDRALHALFSEGWENIKLYFMVGLPGERDEDVAAIPEMALRALKTAKKFTRRFVNVNVGVSPFVPKPHTPMQWCGQEGIERIREKLDFLRKNLSRKKMTFKGHDPDMSLLEAVFARGDERLAGLVERAWQLGCRLDAWTECFDIKRWQLAAEQAGIDLNGYAERAFGKEETLPWEGIETGIRKEFLRREHEKIPAGEKTADCSRVCSGCGLVCGPQASPSGTGSKADNAWTSSRDAGIRKPFRMRLQFSKTGDLRFLSHREVMTAIIRALRRAEAPVLYSQGFHPSPRLSFGPPLPVGISGIREYFDLELRSPVNPEVLQGALNRQLPEGLGIGDVRLIGPQEPSLDQFISRYEYEVGCPDSEAINSFLRQEAVAVERQRQDGRVVTVDLRQFVEDAWATDNRIVRLIALDRGDTKVRIQELLAAIFPVLPEELDVVRTAMQGWRNEWVDPLRFRPAGDNGKGIREADSLSAF